MKHDYHASRVVLEAQPIHTAFIRQQGFLLYPARGRTLGQLHKDYQEITSVGSGKYVAPNGIKFAYAIGWARYQPEQAIQWAQNHIHHFNTRPETRNQFFDLWLSVDRKSAQRWLQEHPEHRRPIDKIRTAEFIRSIALPPLPEHSITLPK